MVTEIDKITGIGPGLMNRIYLKFLKEQISPERYEHSLRVGQVSASLARYYGSDPCQAWQAGLLHDCAREKDPAELKELTFSRNIVYDDFEVEKPVLLHGKVGALFLHDEFPELPEPVLDAVRYHVRGRDGMGDLEQIVYIADFIEPGRAYFKGEFMDWSGNHTLDDLFFRVERTISLYYKNKGTSKNGAGVS